MREFCKFHPFVNLIYFVFVIGFSCLFLHPLCVGLSLACGFVYSVMLKGRKAIKTNLLYILPVLILTMLINPAFNHEGVTVLMYLPSGNPLTAESVACGACSALMLVGVILHFSCFNEVMTSDKIIYIFGKILPSVSLIISMTLRFVPKFSKQLKAVSDAQRCMGRDGTDGKLIDRIKHGLDIISIMTTWALENAADTADSMKSRGYGIEGRSAYSIYTFDNRDKKALFVILALGVFTLFGYFSGEMSISFFPYIKTSEVSLYGLSVFLSFALLCMYPIIVEICEVIKWKALRSKI